MLIQTFLTSPTSTPAPRRRTRRTPSATQLCFEPLEDRCLLSVSPVVLYPVGLTPAASVSGDFNNDGHADLVAANRPESTVSVLLGNGDGTFQPDLTSPTGWRPEQVMAGDLNSDGNTDLVTVNSGAPSAGDLSVLLGAGDGTFQTPQRVGLPAQIISGMNAEQYAYAAVLGDLNADGRLDLVVSGVATIYVQVDQDEYGNPIYQVQSESYLNVLLGNGDGGFGPSTVYLGSGTHKLSVGDFNADGMLDVVTSGRSTLLGNGDGTLQAPLISTGFSGRVVDDYLPVDFNRDGRLDLLTLNGSGTGLIVGLGNGDGTFRGTDPVFEGNAVHAAVAGDVNHDGKHDIAVLVSNYEQIGNEEYRWTSSATVLLGNGDGTFALPITADLGLPVDTYFSSAVLADLDGDGELDVAGSVYEFNRYFYYDDDYEIDHQGFIAVALNDGMWTAPQPPPPTVSIGDVIITEGNSGTVSAIFSVSLSAPSDQPVTVDYTTADGSATAGSDYQAVSGTLTILAGQTVGMISVPVNGDRVAEANETFFVNLGNATNATIADGQGLGTIVDEEPRISIGDFSKAEGKKNHTTLFTFTVTLSAAYDQPITMSFKTVDGTAKTSDKDYVAQTGTLTFLPGEPLTKTITIQVKGDSKREAHESFFVNLYNHSLNSLFTKSRGLGTILNDD